ncbi:VCBS repeat-containing protein [Rossellomorea sp. KS-H15a]|uniref:FG-GAP repeat domain-containing protein n=1 Tax=Rossellomorea sp. KS-H15a TaxID=2963940 RepID=UPI0020C5D6B8|nr:VCBS repeat-containing protein [Rossellomorea sp. KS-H15a]UTE78562.1 VCBS repeat-containing protein [Rossellomorea sp. KS-H15a]
MKKMIVLLTGILFVTSGCSLFQSNSSLMKPPELPVEQQELKQAIQSFVPPQAEWLSPNEDKTADTIQETDLDGDGEEELIVFYRLPEETSQMEGIVLENKEGKWTKVAGIKNIGRELMKVEASDLNGDGTKELLIGFSYAAEASDSALVVYDLEGKKPHKLFESQYSAFFADDYNEDGKGELLLSSLIPNQEHTVSLYAFPKGKSEKVDELKLDPYVYPYYHSASGYVTPSVKGVIFDSTVGAHSSTSFIVGVKNKKLVELVPKEFKDQLFRATSANSEDKNGDGILEFPLLIEANPDKPYVDMPFIHEYYQLSDDGQPQFTLRSYQNYPYQYELVLPEDWPDIIIEASDGRRYVKFLSKEDGSLLFDVYVADKDDKESLEGWNVLMESNQFVYLTKSPVSQFKKSFHPLSSE